MAIGDDIMAVVKDAASGKTPDAAKLENLRLRLNALERLIALSDKVNPQSGDVSEIVSGDARLSVDGLSMISNKDTQHDEAALKFIASSGEDIGYISGYLNSVADTAWVDIGAGFGADYVADHANAGIELGAMSSGAVNSWQTYMFMYAFGDETETKSILDVAVGSSYVYPFSILHDFTARESIIKMACKKVTTGDPSSAVEGMFYYNTFDNAIRMYADGAWRTLSSW